MTVAVAGLLGAGFAAPARVTAQTVGTASDAAATDAAPVAAPETAAAVSPASGTDAAPEREPATTARAPEVTLAAADAETPPDFVAPVVVERWYGWQTLLADLAAVGLSLGGMFLTAGGEGNPGAGLPVIGLGLAAFAGVTPGLHALHHNGWWGGSLAIRAAASGLMFAGAMIVLGNDDCGLGEACFRSGAGLALSGMAIAATVMVGDAMLARERVLEPPPRVALSPWADPRTRAGGLNLAARW